MRSRGDTKGTPKEGGDPRGEGEVTPGHQTGKANVVARARLRGEAAAAVETSGTPAGGCAPVP